MKRIYKVSSVVLLCAVLGIQAYAGGRKGPEVKAVDNVLYKKECASCHFGYQPGLLPSASWQIGRAHV